MFNMDKGYITKDYNQRIIAVLRLALCNSGEALFRKHCVTRQKCTDFVNSIKPFWKPSEEQMEWLKDVIETVPMTCRQQVPLESLYNDLKKLL